MHHAPQQRMYYDYDTVYDDRWYSGPCEAEMPADTDSALVWTAKLGRLDLIEQLVSQGADIHRNEECTLRVAAMRGHQHVVEYLVLNGADVSACDECPITWAAMYGHLNMVKYLESQGADLHAYGGLAMSTAISEGHFEMAEYMMSQGIVDCCDEDLQTLDAWIDLSNRRALRLLTESVVNIQRLWRAHMYNPDRCAAGMALARREFEAHAKAFTARN